jgi:hypothetical protein
VDVGANLGNYHHNGGKSAMKFENNLFDSQVLVRVKCQDREEFNQSLNIKLKMHAQ